MGRGQLLGEAYVKVRYDDLKKLDLKIDESGRKFTAQTDKMSAGLKLVGGAIAGLGIAKFGSDIFQASLKMENLNKMILANEGSQKKANEAMARYLQMAKLPGLNLTQITQASRQFKSLGVSVEQSDKTIKALANTLVLAGRGAEEFGRVSVQFQQMLGKGRLMAEDLRVIAESMPQIRGLMTKAFGTSDTDALAKSGVTAAQFIEKITAEMEKLPKAIGGTQNSIDNFKDSLLQFEAALGKNVLPAVGKFLDKMTSMMDGFEKLPDKTKSAIGEFAMGGAGILGLAFAAKTLGIELSGVAMAIAKNPLLQAALLGYIGGASISKFIPIPGLDEKKGIEAIPRTKEQLASNKLGMLGYELDAMKAVKSGIGANLSTTPVSDLAISYADMIKEIGEASVDFLMNPYGYSTLGGKTKSVFSPRASAREMFGITLPTSNQTIRSPFTSFPSSGVRVGRSNTVDRDYGGPGMGAGLPRDFSLSGGGTGFDIGKWEKINDITNEVNDKAMERWHLTEKESNELDKRVSQYDRIMLKTEGLTEGAYNFNFAWDSVLSELTNKAHTFFEEIYNPSESHEGATGGVDKGGFWDYFAKGVSWITQQGAEFGTSYASGKLSGYAMAEGGTGIVSRPTMFLAGEAGRERVSFEPLSKGGSGSGTFGNTTINVSIVIPNVDVNTISQTQIEKLTRDKIIPALRNSARGGNGQLAMYG